ncbi:hypothetical protein BDP27DRAFT_704528 [Rhodocollybia butyracea]|uniref:Uncharacterized protein n=1 Tax=Rhodocollybia butyracea TaxID=206335 RepID=A0A9P5Q8Z0_9AGAR|nr:hypothetical protein BDP27DRAFT_704528 [Rhodocollybia butyracea]
MPFLFLALFLVAGTFTVVVLAILASILLIFLYIRKKRNASLHRDTDWLEKFAGNSTPRPDSSPSEPALSDDFTHEPMNPDRNPAYYPMDDPFIAQNYSQPGGSASLPDIAYSYARDVNNQYPYYSGESNDVTLSGTRSTPALVGQNPFEPVHPRNPFNPVPDPVTDPGSHSRLEAVLPNPFNEPNFRDSGAYQHSLDSFYGPSITDSRRAF